MYEIYTKEYLSIQKKRFLFQELQLFVGKLRVANRKTMNYDKENDEYGL